MLVVVLAAGCLLQAACGRQAGKTAETEYEVLTVGRTDRTLTSRYAAVIKGKQDVEVRPQVSGCITRILIDEGARVRKGQVLFVIDQVPYRAALEAAVADVMSAEAKLATARITRESKETLFRKHVISQYEFQMAVNAEQEARAVLAQARAQEKKARNDLSYTEVKSPVDGVAGMMPYRVGALVSSSIAEPLVKVADCTEVYAYFSMTENEVLGLQSEGRTLAEAMERMPETGLLLSNGKPYAHKGRIDAVSGIIDQGTGSVSVRAVYPNSEGLLRYGSTGQVLLPSVKKDCIVIPQEATYELQDKVFVYKVVDGKAVSTPVTVHGLSDGKEYIVEEGLKPGDVIVAKGAGLVKDGAEVKAKQRG